MGMHGDYTSEMDFDGVLSPDISSKLVAPESIGLVSFKAGVEDPGGKEAARPLVIDSGQEVREWLIQGQTKDTDLLPQRRVRHHEGSGIVAGAVVSSPVCMTASSDNLLKPWTFSYLYNLAIGVYG